MDQRPKTSPDDLTGKTETEEERVNRASDVCCRACEESGVKVASWRNFEAWKEYVDGKINEAQLTETAKKELEEFSRAFGKYVAVEKKDDSDQSKEEDEKRKRAKHANKIYRKVCGEAGITVCFFKDFGSWSDFVEGKISESEFYERAKREAEQMAVSAH